jgi:hypothetical protein
MKQLTQEQLAELHTAVNHNCTEIVTELGDCLRNTCIDYLKDNNIQTEDDELYDDDWFDYWDEFIQSHFDIVYPQIKRELFR